MDIARYFSIRRHEMNGHERSQPSEDTKEGNRGYLPLLADPINEDIRMVLSSSSSNLEKGDIETSIAEDSNVTSTLAGTGRTSRGNVIIYKQHHEASTIELFYDLFFVANLAYFTAMHQHTDAQSLINYLKLFSLMWFTWLSITLFDVRFGIDCVWNRVHKAIQFGIFTAYVFAGPVFDGYNNTSDAQSYHHFAIVMTVSRAAIAIQYAVVMWQGRMFRQTLLPLGLSTAVHALAAVGYAVTLVVFPMGTVGLEEQIIWVTISIIEGLLIFLIAMIWRIVSFKYTHLVERLQLLTLIIIGEGIIGMVKSVACITKAVSHNNSREIGTATAAVILLYLLWMLYFDQLSSDRFGTVRQQIWSLLHYPLHMAILLCVEGNTSLIVWNSAVQGLKWMWNLEPDDYSDPAAGFTNSSEFLGNLETCMYSINAQFKSKQWNTAYAWERNFTAIENYTATYGFRSEEWNNRTGDVVRYLFHSAELFVFQAHADSLAKLNSITTPTLGPQVKLYSTFDVFNVTVMQFYVGAGSMLLVLAIMYWFNKLHKTKYEFGEMINRVVIGFTLMIVGVAAVVGNQSRSSFKFAASHWAIPIVVLCLVAVLILDNLLLTVSHQTSKRASYQRSGLWGGSTGNESLDDNDTTGLISNHPSNALTPNPNPPTVQLASLHTAFGPYETPTRIRDFAVPTKNRSRGPSRSPGRSEVTLGETFNDRANHDFSYENTPVSALPRGLGIGATVSPLDMINEENMTGMNRNYARGYESSDGADEDEYDRQGDAQHPTPWNRSRSV